ncbi:hypothetical protein VSS24_22430 [Streptomyces nigra]|uniref:hypothetical protein n=1 Tax=Streptomyces nigra TaxID=1827580 RepID=UPI0035E0727A
MTGPLVGRPRLSGPAPPAEGDVPGNVVWSHAEPLAAVAPIKGLLAFYNEAVDITVDGRRLPRPVTPFTAGLRP